METPSLHQSDIEDLKRIAVGSAHKLVEKIATFDEYHQVAADLEAELRRINQLTAMQPETVYQFKGVDSEEYREFKAWREAKKQNGQ